MSITLRGFVMLGTTVPEPSRKEDRIYVCSAGWHPDLGLIRIYPLAMRGVPRRWGVYDVTVERNPSDSRAESWRLAGDRRNPYANHQFHQTGEWSRHDRDGLIGLCGQAHIPTSIAEANERHASLALIQPDGLEFELEANLDSPDSPQQRLFDTDLPAVEGAKRFPFIPRLRFHDGTPHRLMLRDWGAYEFMRKQPGQERDLPKGLHLGARSALLVGNQKDRRTSWLVISVLNVASGQQTLDGVA